ncbi:hypothetical protein E2C01_071694 [Portunus trituberculatus]|uniref:Uncharacterized protein n=1 Tax=Portunus trituberculatus TaxID=210409 RepID=A0A5B7I536_PORTR|nr:hypothetical protein [Portunus trituberculatus]
MSELTRHRIGGDCPATLTGPQLTRDSPPTHYRGTKELPCTSTTATATSTFYWRVLSLQQHNDSLISFPGNSQRRSSRSRSTEFTPLSTAYCQIAISPSHLLGRNSSSSRNHDNLATPCLSQGS